MRESLILDIIIYPHVHMRDSYWLKTSKNYQSSKLSYQCDYVEPNNYWRLKYLRIQSVGIIARLKSLKVPIAVNGQRGVQSL
jgi:hypothetical protein